MKYKHLRLHMRNRVLQKKQVLQNCNLVIDGKSYFSDAYVRSGCQYVLGGEYDRFANYLKNTMKPFIESNITCYVVFNGGMQADLERRKELHQQNIDNPDSIALGKANNPYCDPIFVKNVCREVLEELGIDYYIAEYGNREAMFSLAKIMLCPILTNYYEYCMYGVSCITPKTLAFDQETKSFSCNIITLGTCKGDFNMRDNMYPLFMALIDEDSPYFERLPEVISCRQHNLIPSVLRWLRRHHKDAAVDSITKNLNKLESDFFLKSLKENQKLFFNVKANPKLYFNSKNKLELNKGENWFVKGVASGRIAIPYVNLVNKSTLSGTWVVVDKNKDDAMLTALDIVMYAYGLLKRSQDLKITFIGRKQGVSSTWEIERNLTIKVSNNELFERQNKTGHEGDLFRNFINHYMPGFDFESLRRIPENSWVLIITLVYYFRNNKNMIKLAYSIMLSYVMLGPVSDKVGVIKRSNFISPDDFDDEDEATNDLTSKACAVAVNKLITLFYVDTKGDIDRSVLHVMAEFQHCLQHMNYLNKLCGEKIKCTTYHKVFNATLVYNVYNKLEVYNRPLAFFEQALEESVLRYYKNINTVFEDCLVAVGNY